MVQVLPNKRVSVTWFTYPPEGETGDQAWLIGLGDTVDNRILITEMLRPVGATFGPDFDPETVVRESWGSLEIALEDCNSATADWIGPPAFGSGNMNLIRLTSIDDVECNPEVAPEPDRIISGRSGAWFDPSHDGEGWMLETLPNGSMVVYWFTFDDQGRQAWFVGVASMEGRTVWTEDMLITRGAHFGDKFRAEDVERVRWGSFGFSFEDCAIGKMRYASSDARFGEGTLEPTQLARLAETDCTEPGPVEPLTAGSWRMSTEMDAPTSEGASATAGDFVYTGGGALTSLLLFQRFDPASGSHQNMPELPGPRHHPMMASDGQSIYFAGGYTDRFNNIAPGDNFWRFDPDVGAWEILPNMPTARAAGAAIYMHGRVWIIGGEGPGTQIQAYDTRIGEWELFPGSQIGGLDHIQAVAFENEIWSLGGRSNTTTNQVRVWSPVSRKWRTGPPMNGIRSGFAAKVVQGQIMVAGGEVISIPAELVRSFEVFAPGADSWVNGPIPPVAVHGVTGAVINGEFVLVGGSNIAGRRSQNRATQLFAPATAAELKEQSKEPE